MIVGCVSMFIVAAIQLTADSALRIKYATAGDISASQKDFERARICYQRAYAMDGGQKETLFKLALVEEASGNKNRCLQLIEKIAPRDQAIYAPAHLWKAERLLLSDSVSRDDMTAAAAQLTQVVHLESNNPRANYLLGQLLLSTGNLPASAAHLSVAANVIPEARLLLARVLVLQGNPTEAGRVARGAQSTLRAQLDSNPNNSQVRLLLADATMFLEEFTEAVKLVEEGLILADRSDLRGKLGEIYVAWSDFVHRDRPEDTATRLQLLEQAILANPSELGLFYRLVEMLLNEDKDSTDAGLTRSNLERLLAEGHAPRLIHMLLGTLAGEKGDSSTAIFHLQRAFEMDPAMPITANNLAWYLVLSNPPKAEEALTIIDVLVEKWPDVGYYRDTRGHALAKLGRWQEAISDLEIALETMPNNGSAHRVLAEAYQHLGMDAMASQHEKLAVEMEKGR